MGAAFSVARDSGETPKAKLRPPTTAEAKCEASIRALRLAAAAIPLAPRGSEISATFLLALIGALLVVSGTSILLFGKKRVVRKPMNLPYSEPSTTEPARVPEDDAIYQGNKVVARVLDPQVDWEAREIRFREIYNSDYLLLPEECEFQKYRIIIRTIEYASHTDRTAPQKGRVLRGVVAEVLGYRQQ